MLVCMLIASQAMAQSVAVVALDDTPTSRKTASRMAEMLLASGRSVSFGEPAFARYSERVVALNTTADSKFADFKTRYDKGTEVFFYKGERDAIELLSPLFQLGLAEFGYVSGKPEIADQVFEVGVLLIRAYDGLGRQAERDATAQLVAKYFPAREPSLEKSPPKTIELVRKAKAEIHKSNSKLALKPIGGDGCVAMMNGVEVKDGVFPVASNSDVFVQARCGETRGPLMKIAVKPGTSVVALVPVTNISTLKMSDDSFESRRSAEVTLQGLQFWGGFDEVVGVRTPESDDDPPTLFAHLRGGKITWTETVGVPAFVGYVQQTFDLSAEAQAEPSSTDWLAYTLIGGGVVSIGAGVALFFIGTGKASDLICSGYATEKPSEGDCSGDPLGPFTKEQFESEVSSADTLRVTGVALAGVGVGAITWGIIRLITGSDSDHATISPTHNGVQVWGTF